MEKAMIRANVYEDEEKTIARFMAGLLRSIQRIVEFHQTLVIWCTNHPSASKGSTGGLQSHIQSNYSGKNAAAPIMGSKSAASTSTLVGSTTKSSGI
jgi:hypothetical protein